MNKLSSTARPKYKSHPPKRTDRKFMKVYWPYLPLVSLLVIFTIIVIPGRRSTLVKTSSHVLGETTHITSNDLLAATNSARSKQNESLLSLNPQLQAAAQSKANDMVTRNYWSHITPDGKTPWSFIDATSYTYQIAGENLAYGFASDTGVISGWLSSPAHRANLLGSSYSDVGFGIADATNYQATGPQTVVVAFYARPTSSPGAVLASQIKRPNFYTSLTSTGQQPRSIGIARIQIVTGGNFVWSTLVLAMVTIVLIMLLSLRYAKHVRHAVLGGKRFVKHHPLTDTLVAVTLILAGYLLHFGGVIR